MLCFHLSEMNSVFRSLSIFYLYSLFIIWYVYTSWTGMFHKVTFWDILLPVRWWLGWGVKNFRKAFAGGGVRNIYFVGGGVILLRGVGGSRNLTNLIYFRDIWKMHLLSSDKKLWSFSMAIWRKCLELPIVFPVNLFWSNLHLMLLPLPFSWNSRVWSFFSSILDIETFFGRF